MNRVYSQNTEVEKHGKQSLFSKPTAAPATQVEDGKRVLTMGQGDVGQLGLGDSTLERKKPAAVQGLEGEQLKEVVCGGMHTAVLTIDGKVSFVCLFLLFC